MVRGPWPKGEVRDGHRRIDQVELVPPGVPPAHRVVPPGDGRARERLHREVRPEPEGSVAIARALIQADLRAEDGGVREEARIAQVRGTLRPQREVEGIVQRLLLELGHISTNQGVSWQPESISPLQPEAGGGPSWIPKIRPGTIAWCCSL